MFGLFPHSIGIKLAALGIAFVLGMACGNVRATRGFVEKQDEQFAAATGAMAAEVKRRNVALAEDAARAAAADRAAHDELAAGRDVAQRASAAALQQLARERARTKEIANEYVAVMAKRTDSMDAEPRPVCGWSGDARRLLDAAAGAAADRDSSVGDAATAPAGGAAGPAPAAAEAASGRGESGPGQFLTCEQLYRGYVNLGAWVQEYGIGRNTAWRAWATRRFGE